MSKWFIFGGKDIPLLCVKNRPRKADNHNKYSYIAEKLNTELPAALQHPHRFTAILKCSKTSRFDCQSHIVQTQTRNQQGQGYFRT